jgi:HK97 family phage major capsid protein
MLLSEQMRERRAAKKASLDALLATAETRDNKAMTDEETAQFDALVAEIRSQDARITELVEIEAAESRAAATRVEQGETGEQRTTASTQVTEPDLYVKDGRESYFRDLVMSFKNGDTSARERLHRHGVLETQRETRAVGNTNAAGGSGGEWAPPAWMVDEWINLIRPSRVTADLFKHKDVPFGISSLNYPKLLTGTSVGLQTTQNTALSSTDPTTGYVQTGFATLGGKNVASQQILDQTINFDDVIVDDLAAAYGQQVGSAVFTGTGTGTGTNAVINGLGVATIGSTQTWTQASPTPAGFYGQTGALLSQFLTRRLLPPTHWVMHPRRWYWIESAVDNAGRPFVVPNGNAFNPLATQNGGPVPAGPVGTLHGLPVVLDPLVPINLGAGTNQDPVYLLKADDLVLLESTPRTEVFREPYADSLGVLFRLYAYVGTILNRHTESIGVLTGTGLVTPTFAS